MRTFSQSHPLAAKVVATAAAVGFAALPLLAHAGNSAGDLVNSGLGFTTSSGLSTRDVRDVVGRIINVAMGLLGVVAVVIILAGGFIWMTAGGNEDKVEQAKKLIFSGVIGLAIILTSYAIAQFVVSALVSATSNLP